MSKSSLPSLNALRVFSVVAREKSFKLAATDLEVTQSAISRQIQTLEDQLGMRLLQRDNRVHALTPAGELLAPELQRMFQQLEELINKTISSEAADTRLLKIGVSNELLRWWLGPSLEDFQALYPRLELEFVALSEYCDAHNSERLVRDLAQDKLDAVIIMGQVAGKHIQGVNLGDTEFRLCASEALNNDPETWPAIHYYHVNKSNDWSDWQRYHPVGPALPRFRALDNTSMALDLLRLQGGALLLPNHYDKALQEHKVQVCAGLNAPATASLRLYIARHKERELAVVAFTNWLQHMAKTPPAIRI